MTEERTVRRRKNTKGERQLHLLTIMQSKPGCRIAINDPDVVSYLGRLTSRLVVYMSLLRRKSPFLEVRTVKEIRNERSCTVAYELIEVTTPLDASAGRRMFQHSKYWIPEPTAVTVDYRMKSRP